MKNYFYLLITIFLFSCSEDSPTEVSDPTSFELISPANNETCLEGSKINDTQKEITFRWAGSTNAIGYSLDIINLTTNVGQTLSSNSTSLAVTLNSAEPYSWKVIASGEEGRSEEHTSELQSLAYLVCRLLLEKKKHKIHKRTLTSLHIVYKLREV